MLARTRLESINGAFVEIGGNRRLIHLQFRRFAGCPVCNLHLHSFAQRHQELVAAQIDEVAVFHSSSAQLRRYAGHLPFAVVADPDKRLYASFGVESRLRALLTPRVWPAIARAIFHSLREVLTNGAPMPSIRPEGGRFGLPADFLIGPDGRVLACKYGEHADDHWSVDELLVLARKEHGESVSRPSSGNSELDLQRSA